MDKTHTINEQEAQEIVHQRLQDDGVEITKTLVDKVFDTMKDLAIEGLTKGYGIKLQGLGTIEVRDYEARSYTLPDGTVVDKDAGRKVAIEVSDNLKKAMNL